MKKKDKVQVFFKDNIVVFIFLLITLIAIPESDQSLTYLSVELLARLARYCFLVFALILPIIAGMGINFAMVLGATAGQIGLIFAVDWNVYGIEGLIFASIISLPISIGLGWFCGQILNRARGREMITGFILGYFVDGIYQLFGLYILGNVIPMRLSKVVQPDGIGIRNTLGLDSVRGALDQLLVIKVFDLSLPIATFIIIIILCFFIIWFRKTKLGQNMRAVGEDEHVAHVSGINVNKTRIIAIIISTVMACIGQIIFLQSMGNMSTYTSQRQSGFFAAAAILVGGASKKKASIINVFVGVILIHTLYLTLPLAGNRFLDPQVGQYMSDFINYTIIAIALVLHAAREKSSENRAQRELRNITNSNIAQGKQNEA